MTPHARGAVVSTMLVGVALAGGAGCGDVVNCLTNPKAYRSALLKVVDVPIGFVGAVYQAELRGSIDNEPNDDGFDYHFDLESGALPPGTSLIPDGRSVFITGTPSLAGIFPVKIGVEVDPSLGSICSFDGDPSHASQSISIEIHSVDAP